MEEIKKITLGHLPYNIALVIITPLKSTFYRLKEELNIEETYDKAFFENSVFQINEGNKRGLLVLSPQGISAKDIIEQFNNTDILFFGLAGSLDKKIEIGSFVEVETAIDEEKNNVPLVTTGNFETVKCGYSPCLLGALAKKYCDFAKTMNCDVVDMETVYCAKTAMERKNRFVALLLISDIPEVINFWEISDQMQENLKECRRNAIDKIVTYIDVLTKETKYE